MITLSPGHERPGRLDGSSSDKFAHSHDPEENREHDSADKHREPEYQRWLEHREKALHRDLHFAVIDLGDPVEHLLEATGFFPDQNQLRRKPGINPRLCQRPSEALAFAQARDNAESACAST